MKNSSIILVLVSSVMMNIFTVAGYVRARTVTPEENPTAIVASELGLNEQQADRFKALRAEMNEMAEFCRGNQALIKQDILDEIRSESPDASRILNLVEQSADFDRRLRADGAERFGKFVADLDSEQRQSLFRAMHGDRRGRGGGGDRRLSRFDRNKDGNLDETERAEAAAYFADQNRNRGDGRRGRGRGEPDGWGGPDGRRSPDRNDDVRRQLQNRFDANHDRKLDRAEIDAMVKWLTGGNDTRPTG